MTKGPDFSKHTKRILAKRAGQFCSNPNCRRITSGPHSDSDKSMNHGRAAHIKAARNGGARYDPKMTDNERCNIVNGIWLCIECADVVDKDAKKFTVELLNKWKEDHEKWILDNLGSRDFSAQKELNEKNGLIIKMSSPDNEIAEEAVRILRVKKWLFDGTLIKAKLKNANLMNVDLSDANLEDANLSGASLEGSNLRKTNLANVNLCGTNLRNAKELSNTQLSQANSLKGATMVNGKRYNGRFNLDGDLLVAHLMKIGKSDIAMAAFYDVSVNAYRWGQDWKKWWKSPPQMYSSEAIMKRWQEVSENPDGL